MRFEYRVQEDGLTVHVWLTHITGDQFLGMIEFEHPEELRLFTVSLGLNPMHVVIGGGS